MCTDKDYEEKTSWSLFMGRIDIPPGFVSLLTVDYFHSYLNEMPRPIIHSSFNLRIVRD